MTTLADLNYGFYLGGPGGAEAWVPERKFIEPVIKALAEASGYDADDFTATDLANVVIRVDPSIKTAAVELLSKEETQALAESFAKDRHERP